MTDVTAALLVVKATAILGFALATRALLRRHSATLRHLILAAGFAAVAVLPLAVTWAPGMTVHAGSWLGESPQPAVGLAELWRSSAPAPASREGASGNQPNTGPTVSWAGGVEFRNLVILTWLAGAVAVFAPVVVGGREVRRIRRRAKGWRVGAQTVRALASDVGVRRRLHVRIHGAGPAVFGAIHPTILLPEDARKWPASDLRNAVVHELEHVRRHDCLVGMLAWCVCALYWFRPLVWVAWRQLQLEAERACDDAVIRRGDALRYADQLLALAEVVMRRRHSVLAMAAGRELTDRVRSIVSVNCSRSATTWRVSLSAVVVAVFLGGAMGSVQVVLHARAAPQGAEEPRPTFDVASIKPNRTVNPPRAGFRPDGFEAVNATARQLISLAYSDPRNRVAEIVDGPSWLDSERFDVAARGAVAGGGDPRRGLLMLQSLLGDRFNLRVHRAQHERPVYRLVVGRESRPLGPGLRRAPLDCGTRADRRPAGTPGLAYCGIDRGPGRSTGRSMPMGLLADTLSARVGRTVIDGTGLPGEWDWDLEWTPAPDEQRSPADADAPPPRADGPSIFSAVQEQLGLRLESGRAPLDVLVIDSIERPSAN